MAGSRKRCFYCSDSRGADIEHFAPVSPYFDHTFRWPNLLLVCTECNRKKTNRFPGGPTFPELIDPTVEDPWSYLTLETHTGMVAARFENQVMVVKGVKTLEVLDTLIDEAVAEGRVETVRRIRNAVNSCLETGANHRVTDEAIIAEVRADTYGVTTWFTRWEGQDENPFPALRAARPRLWRRLLAVCAAVEHGA